MSEQKHTPERLKFARHSLVSAIIEDADGNRVAECMATTNDRQYRHNAERLADCWNACKGIPTEALETGRVRDTIDRLMAEAEGGQE